jgi:hypothetical protein
MNPVNNIPTGLIVPAQVPLDAKLFSPNQATLANLGTSNNLAYTYHDSMEVFCMTEKTRWIWREVQLVEPIPGLVASNFTYPNGLIVFGIDYSNKVYNFFPVLPPPVYDELNDLTDVTIGTLANNDLLAYNLSTSQWENQTYAALGIQPTLTQPVTGYGTLNKVPKYSNTSGGLIDSNITDTGALVTVASATNINGVTNIVGATNITGVTTIKTPPAVPPLITYPALPTFVLLDNASGSDPLEMRPSQGGNRNTFIGAGAGKFSTLAAQNNTVLGALAGNGITSGTNNTLIGYGAGGPTATTRWNTMLGSAAGINNTAEANTFIGASAGYNTSTGERNVFIGYNTANKNIIGKHNTSVGYSATPNLGDLGAVANYNTALGYVAGGTLKTGDRNLFLGYDAGSTLNNITIPVTEADQSIFIGAKTTAGPADVQTNQIVIGHAAAGLGSNTTVIGNSSTTLTGLFGDLRLMDGMGIDPPSSTATGVAGTIIVTATYIYVCTATNIWKRVALDATAW